MSSSGVEFCSYRCFLHNYKSMTCEICPKLKEELQPLMDQVPEDILPEVNSFSSWMKARQFFFLYTACKKEMEDAFRQQECKDLFKTILSGNEKKCDEWDIPPIVINVLEKRYSLDEAYTIFENYKNLSMQEKKEYYDIFQREARAQEDQYFQRLVYYKYGQPRLRSPDFNYPNVKQFYREAYQTELQDSSTCPYDLAVLLALEKLCASLDEKIVLEERNRPLSLIESQFRQEKRKEIHRLRGDKMMARLRDQNSVLQMDESIVDENKSRKTERGNQMLHGPILNQAIVRDVDDEDCEYFTLEGVLYRKREVGGPRYSRTKTADVDTDLNLPVKFMESLDSDLVLELTCLSKFQNLFLGFYDDRQFFLTELEDTDDAISYLEARREKCEPLSEEERLSSSFETLTIAREVGFLKPQGSANPSPLECSPIGVAASPEKSGSVQNGKEDSVKDSSSQDDSVPERAIPGKTQSKGTRCKICRAKLSLTAFPCRCGGYYCNYHRYSDRHDCGFDYKKMGTDEIQEANPKVVASKVSKI